jgi:hypothetical protein
MAQAKPQIPLIRDLEAAFERQEGWDVMFSVNGKQIGAHRFMLQARNPILYQLASEWNDGQPPLIIHDMEFDTFKSILR